MKNIVTAQYYIPKNNMFIVSERIHTLVQSRIGRLIKINSLYVSHIIDCARVPSFSIFIEEQPSADPQLPSFDRTYIYKDIPVPNNSCIVVLDKNQSFVLKDRQTLYIECSHHNSISAFVNYDEIY